MAREDTEEKGCSGTHLWPCFGSWGAPCGCFEASELLVTPAFLPSPLSFSPFLTPAQPPTPAQGQEGAAPLLLVGGERGWSWEQGPTSGCSGVAMRVQGVIFLKFLQGRGQTGRVEGAASLPVVSSPPLLFLPSPFRASTSPGCPGDGADVFAREAPG